MGMGMGTSLVIDGLARLVDTYSHTDDVNVYSRIICKYGISFCYKDLADGAIKQIEGKTMPI